MSTINDGGPAFPHEAIIEVVQAPAGVAGVTGGGRLRRAGMSLRDWFAGQALTGLLSAEMDNEEGGSSSCADVLDADVIAEWAYELAGAMLAERAERAKEKQS